MCVWFMCSRNVICILHQITVIYPFIHPTMTIWYLKKHWQGCMITWVDPATRHLAYKELVCRGALMSYNSGSCRGQGQLRPSDIHHAQQHKALQTLHTHKRSHADTHRDIGMDTFPCGLPRQYPQPLHVKTAAIKLNIT